MSTIYDRWHKDGPNGKKVRSAEYGKGSRWQVRWVDEKGSGKANFMLLRGNDPERHAEAFKAQLDHRKNTGTALNIAGSRTLVRDYAEQWRASLLHRESSEKRTEYLLRRWIVPVIGDLRMCDVGASHMRNWIKDRQPLMAPSTLAAAWGCMKHLFNTAVVDRVLSISPCTGVKLPATPKAHHYIPSKRQVYTVGENIMERFRAVVYLDAGTGLRYSEILGLEPDCFDPMLRNVDVRQQLNFSKDGEPYLGPVKSAMSMRTNKVSTLGAESLAKHVEMFPPVTLWLWDRTDPDERKWHEREVRLLFTFPTKAQGLQPVQSGQWCRVWRAAADTAGIPKGVGIHCLRHYFATLLIHKGKSVKAVQEDLGHANPTITMNTYAGHWPDVDVDSRSIVDDELGGLADVATWLSDPPEDELPERSDEPGDFVLAGLPAGRTVMQ